MLPRADIIAVNPVGRAEALPILEGVGDARQQAFQRSLAGLLGKSMQGEVLSKLTDGSFIVRVAGNAARMQLPDGAEVGAKVTLTLVGLEPRPTFEFGGGGPAAALAYPDPAAPSAFVNTSAQDGAHPAAAGDPAATARPASYAAALLSKAPLIPADQLPPLTASDSQPAVLSPAGRMISSVLGAAPQSPSPSAALIGTLPLLPAPGAEPARLAAALHDAVGASGLFYESHLGEWSAGARPLATLLREPQMQGALAAAPNRPGQTDAAISDPATAQFISQQLSTQEQGRVAWQGQLWPGQDLRWEISRDRPGGGARQDGGGGTEPPWRSGLRFRFPLLGEIAATVVLSGDQLHIDVEAGAGAVRDLLRAHAGALGAALAAAGSPLTSLTVHAPARDDG
jgi:hypothetical protein